MRRSVPIAPVKITTALTAIALTIETVVIGAFKGFLESPFVIAFVTELFAITVISALIGAVFFEIVLSSGAVIVLTTFISKRITFAGAKIINILRTVFAVGHHWQSSNAAQHNNNPY